MRNRRLSILFSVGLLTVIMAAPSAAAAMAERTAVAGVVTVGAPATVLSAGCAFGEASADAVPAASGVDSSRGFASFGGGDCPHPPFAGRLSYFAGSGAIWFAQRSPYLGQVLAASNDTTGTSVLFATTAGVFLGKRTQTGSFTAPIRLSRHGNGGAVFPTGDLVTQAGRYWAVWTEQVGPGGEFAQTDLFQAKTIGVGQCTTPITRRQITGVTLHDDTPSLVLAPATGGRSGAHLTWSRNDGERWQSGWIMHAEARCNAQWSTPLRLFSTGINTNPDMTRIGHTDYLSFTHDSLSPQGHFPVVKTLSPNGVTDVTTFGAGSDGTGAATHISAAGPSRIMLLYRTAGRLASWSFNGESWHPEYLTGAGPWQQPVALTQFSRAFTAFGISSSTHRLYAIRISGTWAWPIPPAG